MVGTLVIALALTLAVVVLWSRVISPKRIVDILANAPTPHHARILPYAAHARVAREYPPAFSMVTSEDAGRALHGLLIWRPESPAQAGTLLPSTQTPQDSVAILPDSNPLGIAPPQWCKESITLAKTGFSQVQRHFLEKTIADPDLGQFMVIGSARGMDVIGTRFSFAPQSNLLFMRTLPTPGSSPVYRASLLACASAALRLSRGDAAGAEAVLRAAANAGLLLVDNGGNPLDIVRGAQIARQSMVGLAALYDATGRGAESAKITRELAAPAKQSLAGGTHFR